MTERRIDRQIDRQIAPRIDPRIDRQSERRRPVRAGAQVSRAHAFRVLGLTGSGSLRPVSLHGVLRIRRGGVWLFTPTPRRLRISR